MALTERQAAARAGHVTASFLPALVANDTGRILNEWRGLIGDPSYVPEDLSGRWPVYLGSVLETPVLAWHSAKTGQVFTRMGDVVEHPALPWLSCTLDAWRESDRSCVDVKVCHAFRSLDDILSYYTPQLVIQKACTGADRASLLLVHGSAEPCELEASLTPEYEQSILDLATAFWRCVETLQPPVDLGGAPIVPPERWRRIELDTEADHYNWSSEMIQALETWIANVPAATAAEGAKKTVKRLLPADVGHVRSGRAVVLRARNGAVSIRTA